MKKTALYTFFLLMMGAISCSDEDDSWVNDHLAGVWYVIEDSRAPNKDETWTKEWSFMPNRTMEIVYIISKKSTGEFLGYSTMYKGKYSVKDNTLFIRNMRSASYNFDGENYLEDATYITDKESFRFGEEIRWFSERASVSFQKEDTELALTYLECNDTGDCPGSETLTKKE